MPEQTAPAFFALIPAAGIGARLGAACPKQYLTLAGKPMLQHVLETFAATSAIARVFVVVGAEDGYIRDLMAEAPALAQRVTILPCGGPTRHESVLNGLQALRPDVSESDWILVHDAARPGITVSLIEGLIAALRDDETGGLLAVPVVDTLKRAAAGNRCAATIPRADLWAAQTPQMFRYALLRTALAEALRKGMPVTDDASAVEALGLHPKLVEGSARNIKVTMPEDVRLAELYLAAAPPLS